VSGFCPPEVRFGHATLPGLLERAAGTDHGLIFADSARGERRLGFAELHPAAMAAAAALAGHGVRAGDRVCLLGSTSPELVAALWGVWCAGGVAVVLPPPRRGADAADLGLRVRQADAGLLVVADELAAGLEGQVDGARVLALGHLRPPAPSPGVLPTAAESDLALLQFTSGTTARSRAVALTHRQILANLSAFSDALRLSSEDRAVSWLPLYHDMGILIMIAAVAHPGDLVLAPTEDFVRRPGFWMDAVSRLRATITVGPNQAYGLAARDLRMRPRELDLSCLRIAGNGAEPVAAAVLDEFAEQAGRYGFKGTALCPMYGLAEATLAVTISAPGESWQDVWVDRDRLEKDRVAVPTLPQHPGARRLVACGPPVPGAEVDIRDPAGAAVAEGLVGEIWVRSPSIMIGYWRDEEASRAVLHDGWLRTGDLGFMHGGQLVVCGRAKDMIVVGGRNLYPEDYEQLVATHVGVRRGNVIAFGLADLERMVVVAETAFTNDRARQLAVDVMRALTQELSHAPEEVVMVRPGTLPKTSSGKVQRGVCRDRYLAGELTTVAKVAR